MRLQRETKKSLGTHTPQRRSWPHGKKEEGNRNVCSILSPERASNHRWTMLLVKLMIDSTYFVQTFVGCFVALLLHVVAKSLE
jgi:hypothetical protein